MQQRARNYDKGGDAHYDTVSAFIKSMRGSDPDAAIIYYLARMIEGGEDPRCSSPRRLVILASGRQPSILPTRARVAEVAIMSAAQRAVHFIGMPEGHHPLAHAVLYPRDRAERATRSAARTARRWPTTRRLAATTRCTALHLHATRRPSWMKNLGYGSGYHLRAATNYAAMDAEGRRAAKRYGASAAEPSGSAGVVARTSEPGKQGDEKRLRAWIDARQRQCRSEDPIRQNDRLNIHLDNAATTTASAGNPIGCCLSTAPFRWLRPELRRTRTVAPAAPPPRSKQCARRRREGRTPQPRARSSSPAAVPRRTCSRSSARPKRAASHGKHVITATAFEHHAVLHAFDVLEDEGWTALRDCRSTRDGLRRARRRRGRACGISTRRSFLIMLGNSEIGTIQPLAGDRGAAHTADRRARA